MRPHGQYAAPGCAGMPWGKGGTPVRMLAVSMVLMPFMPGVPVLIPAPPLPVSGVCPVVTVFMLMTHKRFTTRAAAQAAP